MRVKSPYKNYSDQIKTVEEIKEAFENACTSENKIRLTEFAHDNMNEYFQQYKMTLDIRTLEVDFECVRQGTTSSDSIFYIDVLALNHSALADVYSAHRDDVDSDENIDRCSMFVDLDACNCFDLSYSLEDQLDFILEYKAEE